MFHPPEAKWTSVTILPVEYGYMTSEVIKGNAASIWLSLSWDRHTGIHEPPRKNSGPPKLL